MKVTQRSNYVVIEGQDRDLWLLMETGESIEEALRGHAKELRGKIASLRTRVEFIEQALAAHTDQKEVLPGAVAQEIRHYMLQDLVGDYDTPDQVPEWAWIERNACFAHVGNGDSGVWEFVVNMAAELNEAPPEKLEPVIRKAREDSIAYLIFHQGT